MAASEAFMKGIIKRMARAYDAPILEGNKPINFLDALRQAADSRMGIQRDAKGAFVERGNNLFENIGGKLANDTDKFVGIEKGPSDWQRLKSFGYNLDGTLNYGRTAGMAVGFGGGAIAGLNLAGDIVF